MSFALRCYSECIYMTPPICMHTLPFTYRCIIYDGSQCVSVFGQANITDSSSSPTSNIVYLQDLTIIQNRKLFSTANSQNCQNYLLLLGCTSAFSPCSGSAWCGSNSKDALKNAVADACMCNNADSCVINGLNVSAVIDSQPNYFEGSSITGAVGNSGVTCQDVTVGKWCRHTVNCTHHHTDIIIPACHAWICSFLNLGSTVKMSESVRMWVL